MTFSMYKTLKSNKSRSFQFKNIIETFIVCCNNNLKVKQKQILNSKNIFID